MSGFHSRQGAGPIDGRRDEIGCTPAPRVGKSQRLYPPTSVEACDTSQTAMQLKAQNRLVFHSRETIQQIDGGCFLKTLAVFLAQQHRPAQPQVALVFDSVTVPAQYVHRVASQSG